MKPRQRRVTDPTAESVYSAEFLDMLDVMLAKMPLWEGQALRQHLGLRISTPDQQWLDLLSPENYERLVNRGRSRLLHPARVLDAARLLGTETFNRVMGMTDTRRLTRCERHGDVVRAMVGGKCSECPCPVGAFKGKLKDYCSPACKQAGYRRRLREKKAA